MDTTHTPATTEAEPATAEAQPAITDAQPASAGAEVSGLDALEAAAAGSPALNRMSMEKLRSLLKARKGFEPHVLPLLALYEAESVSLGTKFDPRAVLGHALALEALAKKQERAEAELRAIMDERLVEGHNVWAPLLEIYGKAGKDPDLRNAEAVVNFRKFMKHAKKAAAEGEAVAPKEGQGEGGKGG